MTTPPTWTEDHIEQLLHSPQLLLAEEPWRNLIVSSGGLDALYAQLQTLPLPEREQAVLAVVTNNPGASADDYGQMLHVHRTTFYRQQRQMFRSLAALLNATNLDQHGSHDRPPPSGRASVLHQLRPPISDFIGRGPELAALLGSIRRGSGHKPQALLGGIHGMGGIGKTELAYAVAHQVIDQFPDAQLVLELRGSRETPMTTAEALQAAIRSFLPQEKLPDELDALQQRYRSLLHDKRVLLVVDDARDANHVRALIPPLGCLLLVTSRQRWTLPGMESVHLEPLSAAEAPAFLRQLCERLSDDDAGRIAAACDHLPLALRVCGSMLANNPALSVAKYIQKLTSARHRIALLRDPDDAHLNVAASLDLSYAALDVLAQRLLRHLGVLVADFDTDLALEVADLPEIADGEDLLHTLLRRNVIFYDAQRDRWRLHDLVRALALQKLEASGEEAEIRHRYARAVVNIARQIKARYRTNGDGVLTSLARFDLERAHIDELWRWVFDHVDTQEGDRVLVDTVLATTHAGHVRYNFKYERKPQAEAALLAVQRLNDLAREGEIYWLLGVISHHIGDIHKGIEYQNLSLDILEKLKDEPRIADVMISLANGYNSLGGEDNIKLAIKYYENALMIFDKYNYIREIDMCYSNLGLMYNRLNDYDKALLFLEKALISSKKNENPIGRLRSLNNIGSLYISKGDLEKAIYYLDQALIDVRKIKQREGEGHILCNLAQAHARLQNMNRSYTYYERGIQIFYEIDHVEVMEINKWKFGILILLNGDRDRAISMLRSSLEYKNKINHMDLEKYSVMFKDIESCRPITEEMLKTAGLI